MTSGSERGVVTPDELARWFHQEYERMAPSFGYATREASAVPWEQVPEQNRRLMGAVAASALLRFFPDRMAVPFAPPASDVPEPPGTSTVGPGDGGGAG